MNRADAIRIIISLTLLGSLMVHLNHDTPWDYTKSDEFIKGWAK